MRMIAMKLFVIILISVLSRVRSQISTSADLNCSFEVACRWRNATAGEDSGDFLITHNVTVDGRFDIIPSKNGPEQRFAYTQGPFDGLQKAVLISDTISCQLGGGTLTFWYYRTGNSATLDVCVRQPPGNMDTVDLRCFPVFATNHAHQWLFSAIEFPPLSQAFELLIRSDYIQPFDIIAIDDVRYDAALCGVINSNRITGTKIRDNDITSDVISRHQGIRSRRRDAAFKPPISKSHVEFPPLTRTTRLLSPSAITNTVISVTPPPLIGYYDWEILKNSSSAVKHPTMLVVAQEEGNNIAALLPRTLRELPLQTSITMANESTSVVRIAWNNTENATAVKSSLSATPPKSSVSEISLTEVDTNPRRRYADPVATPLTSTSNSTTIKADSKLAINNTNVAQQAFSDFVQKFAPLVFPALAGILKSSDTQSQLQRSIDENANYVGSPQRFRMVQMKSAQGTGIDSTNTTSDLTQSRMRGLKIEKIRKNRYGMTRKIRPHHSVSESRIELEISGASEPQNLKSAENSAGEHFGISRKGRIENFFTDEATRSSEDGDIETRNVIALSNAEIEKLKSIYSKLFG